MATKDDDNYEPEPGTALVARAVDADLSDKLTGKPAVESIAAALRAAAFEFEPDDLMTLGAAESLTIDDADDYARGYDLLGGLGSIEKRITDHYAFFDKPLNFLIGVVRGLKKPQTTSVTPVKQALSRRLGDWKAARAAADRIERERKQAVADQAAQAAQDARAKQLEQVAAQEADPRLAKSFLDEAAAVRSADVKAAPVEDVSSVPVLTGTYTRTTWTCEIQDIKALLAAYVEGKCFLDEDDLKAGIQSFMNKQAANLGQNLSKAFPGTRAVPKHTGVTRST